MPIQQKSSFNEVVINKMVIEEISQIRIRRVYRKMPKIDKIGYKMTGAYVPQKYPPHVASLWSIQVFYDLSDCLVSEANLVFPGHS